MNSKEKITLFLSYNRTQRLGFISLITIIVVLQFCISFSNGDKFSEDQTKLKWLSHQGRLDSLKDHRSNHVFKIYPFNPNYLTDFKGYKLGMSVEEIDRLIKFRSSGKYVNSEKEFQQVTKVSDSLLKTMSPYFKFPSWIKSKSSVTRFQEISTAKNIVKGDINTVGKVELMQIYGIGDKLSDRILEYKSKLGAFVSIEQLNEIWGLSPTIVAELKEKYEIKSATGLKKINVNQATVKELIQLPYLKYNVAKEIVIFRSMNGDLKIEDLAKIKHFPVENIKIIALYLEF